jgi:hypothetical protein
MTAAAANKMTIPRYVGFGSLCPSSVAEHGGIKSSEVLALSLIRVSSLLTASLPPCCGLNFLKPGLVKSRATVIIPFDDRVIFVGLFNCAEFSSRLSEVAQTLDAISGIQFLVGGRGLGERWPFGTVGVRSRPWV